jgi:uncharacterized protein with HEPN domain
MRREKLYLQDIIEACDDIREFIGDSDLQAFKQDKRTKSAVLQKLAVIGEAASRIPVEFRRSHSEVEWKEIADFRNRLIHGYFNLDWEIIWVSATEETPALREQIAQIIKQEFEH